MSDYDWSNIRLKYELGQTCYKIAQEMGGRPSKQAIAKRAKREGWEQTLDQGTDRLPIIVSALKINSRILTDELLQTVLGMIGIGSSEAMACQAAGINPGTWIDWKHQDERLQNAVQRARAGKLSEWIGRIDKAARKDWKAAQALLQSAPETKGDFGKDAGPSKLEVVININREAPGVTINQASEVEG